MCVFGSGCSVVAGLRGRAGGADVVVGAWAAAAQVTQDEGEEEGDDEVDGGGFRGEQDKAGAAGHADGGGEPDRGGGGEARDDVGANVR